MRRLPVLFYAACLLGTAALVGTDMGSAGAAPSPLSGAHLQLITDGDRICTETALKIESQLAAYETVKISGFRQKKGHRALPAKAEAFVRQVGIPENLKALAQLSALTPPSEDVGTFKDLIAGARTALNGLAKGQVDVVSGNLMVDTAKKFKAFGFSQCGSNRRPSESSSTKKK